MSNDTFLAWLTKQVDRQDAIGDMPSVLVENGLFDSLNLTGMTIADWLMIVAVILGPIIAVQLTRYIDNQRAITERKLEIFKILMSTRSYPTSWDHVLTLNKIDIEFNKNNKREQKVIEAWKSYLDLLMNGHMNSVNIELWASKRVDLLVELLYEMAIVLNYSFDKTHIKNSSYAPVVHSDMDAERRAINQGLIKVFNGDNPLSMNIMNWPNDNIENESVSELQS